MKHNLPTDGELTAATLIFKLPLSFAMINGDYPQYPKKFDATSKILLL